MTIDYKLVTTPTGEEVIQYEANGFLHTIPKDPANSDYQRYLNPEAEQSTPIVINEAKTK
jgi:hypothetical protein